MMQRTTYNLLSKRGNPKLVLSPEEQLDARNTIRKLKALGITHKDVKVHLGINNGSVASWFNAGALPGRTYYTKLKAFLASLEAR